MCQLVISLIIAFCNWFVLAGMSGIQESPYGLIFTPTAVMASRFIASGSVEITRRPLGPEYQELYRDAVQQFDKPTNDLQIGDKSRAESIFRTAIIPVTEELSQSLGHVPEYAALFFPSVFSFPTINAAVAGVLGDYGERPIKAGRAVQATSEAYGFLEGKNLGRTPEQCNDDEILNLVIVLEYEKDYLYVWLLEVAFELRVCPPVHESFCMECGEQAPDDIGTEAYRKRVNDFLATFVEQVLQKHERDSIRAIIVSGEASVAWATELGEMVRNAVGSESAKIMTDIKPSEVAAFGAAVWARMVQKESYLFEVDSGNRLDYETSHDEL